MSVQQSPEDEFFEVVNMAKELALWEGEISGFWPVGESESSQSKSSRASAAGESFAALNGRASDEPSSDDRRVRLANLAVEASSCTRCALHTERTRSVFARGNPFSLIAFVGEGPGYHEDQQGLPFVGAAGQLLDRMIAAMGFQRDDVYVCNVVKCRPPENRTPLPDEMNACMPFLEQQLQAVAPKVIVALGRCAAQSLGAAMGPSGRWRGTWIEWQSIPVLPTYHPAFLLRNPENKRQVWEDLQLVMARLAEMNGA